MKVGQIFDEYGWKRIEQGIFIIFSLKHVHRNPSMMSTTDLYHVYIAFSLGPLRMLIMKIIFV